MPKAEPPHPPTSRSSPPRRTAGRTSSQVLNDGQEDVGCWCQPWRGDVAKGESRPDALQRQLARRPAAARVPRLPRRRAGRLGRRRPRARSPRGCATRGRSRRSTTLDVWAIGCFRIRPGFRRRRGVATALLEGVVAAAREAGAPGVEAYPIDPAGPARRRRVRVRRPRVRAVVQGDGVAHDHVVVAPRHPAAGLDGDRSPGRRGCSAIATVAREAASAGRSGGEGMLDRVGPRPASA